MPNPNENDKRFLSIRSEFRANDAKLVSDLRSINNAVGSLSNQQKGALRKKRFKSHAEAFAAYLEALNKGFEDNNSQQISEAHEALKSASKAVKDARAESAAISDILNKLSAAADKAKKLVDLFD